MSGNPQRTDDPAAQTLLRQLDATCKALATHEGKVAEHAAKRNDLFVRLLDLGVTQREVAGRAKISEPAVAKAVKKARAAQPA